MPIIGGGGGATFTGGTLSGPTSNAGVLQVHTTSATPGNYGFLMTDHNGSVLFGSTVIGFTTEVLVFGAISGGMNIWANLPADNYPSVGVDSIGDVNIGNDTGAVGFYGVTPTTRPAAGDIAAALAALGLVSTAARGATLNAGVATTAITSGALPTAAFVSATARQASTTRDVTLVVPFTGDATNNAATLKIELSPDNVTFSTLDTLSIAAALNLTGALNTPVTLTVPAAWWVKLTATHGTIGTGTYY